MSTLLIEVVLRGEPVECALAVCEQCLARRVRGVALLALVHCATVELVAVALSGAREHASAARPGGRRYRRCDWWVCGTGTGGSGGALVRGTGQWGRWKL